MSEARQSRHNQRVRTIREWRLLPNLREYIKDKNHKDTWVTKTEQSYTKNINKRDKIY